MSETTIYHGYAAKLVFLRNELIQVNEVGEQRLLKLLLSHHNVHLLGSWLGHSQWYIVQMSRRFGQHADQDQTPNRRYGMLGVIRFPSGHEHPPILRIRR